MSYLDNAFKWEIFEKNIFQLLTKPKSLNILDMVMYNYR